MEEDQASSSENYTLQGSPEYSPLHLQTNRIEKLKELKEEEDDQEIDLPCNGVPKSLI